jgi:cell division protein FtsX
MVFKIKLEDKAAFLNRMEKQGQAVDTQEIKNNKLEGYFEVTINNPEQEKMARDILKQSPKINTIKEIKRGLTKNKLKEMIRQELNLSNKLGGVTGEG